MYTMSDAEREKLAAHINDMLNLSDDGEFYVYASEMVDFLTSVQELVQYLDKRKPNQET